MIEIVRSDKRLGAEVRDVDLGRPLDDETRDAVKAAWLEYLVLLFRGQSLDDDALIAFTAAIGVPQEAPNSDATASFGAFEGVNPAITIISNIEKDGKPIGALGSGEADWHTDMSYIDIPPAASILHARQIPDSGGDTLFCNMYAAYEALDADIKAQIDGRRAIHDFTYTSAGTIRIGHDEVGDVREAPGARHPLVRTHPETGRKCLFLGRRVNGYVLDLPVADSEALLDRLWAAATDPALTWSHRWREGDVLMWDNRCVMHRREAFDPAAARLMHRTQVTGDRPY